MCWSWIQAILIWNNNGPLWKVDILPFANIINWSKRVHKVENYKYSTNIMTIKQGSIYMTCTCMWYISMFWPCSRREQQKLHLISGTRDAEMQMFCICVTLVLGRCLEVPLLVKASVCESKALELILLTVSSTCRNKLLSNFQNDLQGQWV